MDLILFLAGILLVMLGVVGSFLPVLPGPLTGWFGLWALHATKAVPDNWPFLGITLAIAIAIFLLDYIIPLLGTKKFGGTKSGMIGTTIGLVLGVLFFPPFGIIIGPFIGAFAGEMSQNKDTKKAFRAALGSFIGFLTGTFLKLGTAVVFVILFVSKAWPYKAELLF